MRDNLEYLKARLMGITLCILATLTVILSEGDVTVAVFIAPLVLFLIFAKFIEKYFAKYLAYTDFNEDEEEEF